MYYIVVLMTKHENVQIDGRYDGEYEDRRRPGRGRSYEY